jgi:diguanylate cyclase (GGDEF)-like protein
LQSKRKKYIITSLIYEVIFNMVYRNESEFFKMGALEQNGKAEQVRQLREQLIQKMLSRELTEYVLRENPLVKRGNIVAIQQIIDDLPPSITQKIREQIENQSGGLISKMAEYKQRIAFDDLTGAMKPSTAGELFEMIRAEQKRSAEQRATVFVRFDLDGFKAVNDRLGHDVGDNVLREIASALKTLRPTDIVIRFSGDEFGLVLTNVKIPPEQVGAQTNIKEITQQIIARVIKKIEDVEIKQCMGKNTTEEEQLVAQSMSISASAGFKIIMADDEGDFDDFSKQADRAARFSKDLKFVVKVRKGS